MIDILVVDHVLGEALGVASGEIAHLGLDLPEMTGDLEWREAAVEEPQDITGERGSDWLAGFTAQRLVQGADRLLVMILDGPDTEAQFFRYFLVGEPIGLQAKYLALPASKARATIGSCRDHHVDAPSGTPPSEKQNADLTEAGLSETGNDSDIVAKNWPVVFRINGGVFRLLYVDRNVGSFHVTSGRWVAQLPGHVVCMSRRPAGGIWMMKGFTFVHLAWR
ncbi:MAG TPA: hypothetical protein VFQ54_05015 [Thermomicrobiales bacterium]|nr:hypothetical protein [Thermomicrobiales bacterium]